MVRKTELKSRTSSFLGPSILAYVIFHL